MKRIFPVALSLVLFISMCVPAISFGAKGNTKNEISIAFSHDIHSHLESKDGTGGLAKMATILKDFKEQNPNIFVFDGGDFSMGTPYQTIYKSTATELRMLGLLGFDATTIGNHEYDHRTKGLTRMLKSAIKSSEHLPQIVISNIDWEGTLNDKKLKKDAGELKKALEEYGYKDYTIINKGGIKVAAFGIMGKEADSYAPESGLKFLDPVKTADKVVKKIKAKEDVDFIVCLSHSGTNENDPEKSEDEILAKEVEGIDFILSGHSHTKLSKPIVINNTVIGSVGQYTDNLGYVTFTKGKNGYKLKDYKLISLDKDVIEDEEALDKILEFRELVDKRYFSNYGYSIDSILAYNRLNFTDIDDFGDKQGEDTLGNLIADSFIYGVKVAEGKTYEKVDVAVVPSGVVRGSFKKGPITVADAFNALSLGIGPNGMAGYPLVSIYLTGAELKTMAEVDISVSEIMEPARLYISGLKYWYNPHRLFLNRVTGVSLDLGNGKTEEIQNKKLYRVVGDLYSCQMLGTVEKQSFGLLKISPKDKEGNPIGDFEKHIVKKRNGKELKEWWSLTKYIDSFPKDRVPAEYSQLQGRKILSDSTRILDILRNPNKIFWIVLGVGILFIAVVVFIVFLIVGIIRRSRGYSKKRYKRKYKEQPIFSNRKNKYNSKWQ